MEDETAQENLTKKERREIKKIEKHQELARLKRRVLVFKYLKTAFILVLLAVVGYIVVFLANEGTSNLPGQFFEEQSRNHINSGEPHPDYSSNPPTSGWHYPQPAQTGIYDQELPDEQIIHNLEHGHVWISYNPDKIDQETVEKLADIAKDFGSKIIMAPRRANDSAIALAVWQYLLKLDFFDEKAVREFIKTHRGKAGPENPPDYGFKDFRKR